MLCLGTSCSFSQNLLKNLSETKDFKSKRISSYDSSGGNNDRISIEPGKSYLVLEASGKSHYVGCNLRILQRAMGWRGEGGWGFYARFVDPEKELTWKTE